MTRQPPQSDKRPPGFSLLELIVVIGIIALLASISFAVIGSMLDQAKGTATETTIAKIHGLLKQQITGFYAQHDPRDPEMRALAGKFRSPPINLTADRETSLVLATKASFARSYPQNVYEVYGFDRSLGGGDDTPLFSKWAAANIVSTADSSELLFIAMTEGKVRGIQPVDRSVFTSSELGDTDGDDQLELIDGWGQPLRYYRWPTRLVNPFGYIANRLASGVGIAVTSIDLVDASGFSGLTTPFNIVIGREIMEVTNIAGNTMTVVRGAQSTDASGHAAGSRVKIAPFTDLATLLLGFVNSDILSKDPDDRFGSVAELTSGGGPAHLANLTGSAFSSTGAIGDYELLFHTLDSYHAPLIVSAGPDGELGLVEPGPTGGSGTNEPGNFWLPATATTIQAWRWGALAQPDTGDGNAAAIVTLQTNPGDSVLADNITNYNGSN